MFAFFFGVDIWICAEKEKSVPDFFIFHTIIFFIFLYVLDHVIQVSAGEFCSLLVTLCAWNVKTPTSFLSTTKPFSKQIAHNCSQKQRYWEPSASKLCKDNTSQDLQSNLLRWVFFILSYLHIFLHSFLCSRNYTLLRGTLTWKQGRYSHNVFRTLVSKTCWNKVAHRGHFWRWNMYRVMDCILPQL